MTALEVVIIFVCVVAIVLAVTNYLRSNRAVDELGHQGQTWFEHPEDRDVTQRPSEDAADQPLPRRPLRARARAH